MSEPHPENHCNRCGGKNVPWSAPSPLWNQVMRGGDINGEWQHDEIICPTCFADLAEQAGVAELWRFYAERVKVPLQTVTPTGRVWDADAWLWRDPETAECGGVFWHGEHPMSTGGYCQGFPPSRDAALYNAGDADDHP